jgi:hypothetical protein
MFDIALRHEYTPMKPHREQGCKYLTQHTKKQCLNSEGRSSSTAEVGVHKIELKKSHVKEILSKINRIFI